MSITVPQSLDPRDIARKAELGHLLKMKRDGYSNEQIARTLRINPLRVNILLTEALEALQGESKALAREIREIELQRLDVATRALMPRVENGDLGAINSLLKVQIRRANYLGLDSQVSSPGTVTVNIAWASPDRLSYQRTEVVDAPTGVPWKEPVSDAGLAAVLRHDDKKG